MVTSINDEIRKNIINKYSKELTILNLEKLDSDTYDEVISLFLLDYFKINFFMGNFDFLDDFNDSKENVIERTLNDEEFLTSILSSSIIFNLLCITSKITMLEELENMGQDDALMKISKLHVLDKICYSFDYNLESFKEYYTDFKNKNERHPRKTDVSYFIATKLTNYKDIRYNEFQKMVLEFLKVYYKLNIFVRDNCPKKSLEKEDYFYKSIRFVEKVYSARKCELSCSRWIPSGYESSQSRLASSPKQPGVAVFAVDIARRAGGMRSMTGSTNDSCYSLFLRM